MQLTKIISALPSAPVTVKGPADREITSLTHDSRQATPGCLFVALPSVTPGRTGQAAGGGVGQPHLLKPVERVIPAAH